LAVACAQIESSGLFYSYAVGGARPGRIVFVPARTVPALVGSKQPRFGYPHHY